MANEMMQQALRGADYQVPDEGYFGAMPKYSLGAYGQPREPGQPVIPQEALQQAMAPPPAPVPEAAPTPPPRAAPPPKSVDTGRVREQPWTKGTFNAGAYTDQYPDLQAAMLRNPKFNAFDHWQKYGQNENRFSGQTPETSKPMPQAAPPTQGPMPQAPAQAPPQQQQMPPGFTPPTPEQIAQVRASLGAPPMGPQQAPPMPMNPVAPQIQLAQELRRGGGGGMGRGGGARMRNARR